MQLYFSKLYVFLLLTILRLISGLSPLLISRKIKRKYGMDNVKTWIDKCVSCCMDFSGGILLATCFIHMIPEVREELVESFELFEKKYTFPYAETLVCVGFFTVFVIEESVKHMLTSKPSHSAKKSDALISSKMNEMSILETTNKNIDDREKEISTANADMSGDSNGIGIAISLTANNGLMLEMNSMIREDMSECNNNTKSASARNLRNFLLITALSFHSVMEGLAIGLAQKVEDVWYLFLAVTIHECTILLCIGIEMVASCTSASTVIVYIVVFALVSPLGVLFGTLITSFVSETRSSWNKLTIGSLQGLAAGTILYVTFFEVLNNHKHHHHHGRTHQSKSGLPKLIFIALGFLFMVVLELIGGHSSGGGHAHEHLTNNASICH